MTQEALDKEYIWLYTPVQMMNDPSYGNISYNSSLSNDFMLKLEYNVKLLLVEMKTATGKNIG
jgi:hypothetical protein